MNAQQLMQRRSCVLHRHRSPAHIYVFRKSEQPGAAVALCQQLFSGSFDECAAALPYETSPCLLNGLAYFATNLLACVANAFAFVRFRWIETADISCNLAH